MKSLIVLSPSTKKYLGDITKDRSVVVRIVKKPPTPELLKEYGVYGYTVAMGGGSVIDTAKILSKYRVVAYPTTYAGASETSHAVIWDKDKKVSILCKKPYTTLHPEINMPVKLPKDIEEYSKIDCLCHIMESMISKYATRKSNRYAKKALKYYHEGKFMDASLYAGKAIELTGTNLLHGLSYPLTYKYGVPHGKALATILHEAMEIPKVKELL